jgi:WD40 repeat protein
MFRRVIAALAVLAWACGAAEFQAPAEAKPRAAAKHPAASRGPVAIGAGNVDRLTKVWEAAAGGFGRAVAVSRKLVRVAVSSGSPVKVYDLYSGRAVATIPTCADVIRGGIAYVGNQLVVVCESGVRVYEGTAESAQRVDANPAKITAASFAGSRLALGHHDGVVRIYGLDGSAPIEIPVPGPPIDVKSLALTRDGSRVAVGWVQGSIWWWETAQPTAPHPLTRRDSESDSVAWSDDGALFAEEGNANTTSVWSFGATPGEQTTIRNGDWVKRIRFTRDGKWLVRGGSDGLDLAEIAGPRRVVLESRGSVEDVALDELGALIAAVDRDGRLTVWGAR